MNGLVLKTMPACFNLLLLMLIMLIMNNIILYYNIICRKNAMT